MMINEQAALAAADEARRERGSARFASPVGTKREIRVSLLVELDTKRGSARLAGMKIERRQANGLPVPFGDLLAEIYRHADIKGQPLLELLKQLRGENKQARCEVPTKIAVEVVDHREDWQIAMQPRMQRKAVRVSALGFELAAPGELSESGVAALWMQLAGRMMTPLKLSPEDTTALKRGVEAL